MKITSAEGTAAPGFTMGQGNLVPDRDSWQLQGLLGHGT